MNYIAVSHDEYLVHHGVKGMKWGVRRQKKREERERIRARRQRMYSRVSQYGDEFDKSDYGSMLKRHTQSARNKFNNYGGNNKFDRERLKNDFISEERGYLKSKGSFIATTLLKDYGYTTDDLSIFVDKKLPTNHQEAVRSFGQEYYNKYRE